MISKTTKTQMRQQIRRVKEATRRNLVKGHYAKYRYGKNWLKAHAKLLKELAA
jgi:hypothetical protein